MAEIPKIAVQRLASASMHLGESHPDENLLSAFVERTLEERERLQVLNHLAQCFVCRETVSLALPEVAAETVVSRPIFAPKISWPVLRWGAALACVLVVGAAVTLRQKERANDQTHSGEGAPAVATAAVPDAAEKPSSVAAAASEVSPIAKAAPAEVETRRLQPGRESGTREKTTEIAQLDAMIPGRAKDDLAANEPTSSQMAGEMAVARAAAPAASQSLKLNLARVPRWTLAADGSLQRSFDMGQSWEPVTVSVEASLRALAANGFDIWVGGNNGALFHSADAGEHWLKVQPIVAGQPLTADIIGVEFPDLQNGRLTTSAGETWTTQDGGLTWQTQ